MRLDFCIANHGALLNAYLPEGPARALRSTRALGLFILLHKADLAATWLAQNTAKSLFNIF